MRCENMNAMQCDRTYMQSWSFIHARRTVGMGAVGSLEMTPLRWRVYPFVCLQGTQCTLRHNSVMSMMVDITNRRQQKNMHMYGTCAHTPTCSCCIARTSSARSAAISMPANNMVSRRFKRVSAHLRIEVRSTIQHACRRSSTQDGTVLSRIHCVTNTTMHGRS